MIFTVPGLQNPLFRASWLCWLIFTITLSFFSALLLFGQSSPILSLHSCFLIFQNIMELHLHLLKYVFIFPDLHCSNQTCWPVDWEDAKEHRMGFPCAFLPCPPCSVLRPCVPPPSCCCNKHSHFLSAWTVVRGKKFTSVSHYLSCDIFVTKPFGLTELVLRLTFILSAGEWFCSNIRQPYVLFLSDCKVSTKINNLSLANFFFFFLIKMVQVNNSQNWLLISSPLIWEDTFFWTPKVSQQS